MAPQACPSCKSTNLTEDDHGGETHHVCKDCGEVIKSTASFEQDMNYWSSVTFCNAAGSLQGTDFGRCRNSAKVDPNGAPRKLIPWLKYVREVCGMMKLTSEMQKGATELFTQAFNHPNFRYKQRVKKQGLCGAVIFVLCRRQDWPVLLPDISDVVQCPKSAVFNMLELLNRDFNINIKPQSNCEDVVTSVLKKYRLSDDTFREKTIKLVGLAKDAWITCGRSYDAIILGAAYLVWKASEGKGKGSLSQVEFKKRFKIAKPPAQMTKRVGEIRQVLNQLYLKLPWVKSSGKVRTDTALWHLDDILSHKRFLISRVGAPTEDEDADEVETDETQNEQTITNPCGDATVNSSNPPSSRGILPPACSMKRKAKTRDTGMEPARKIPTLVPWNPEMEGLDEELTEKDIPESEMHLYVRSQEEIEQFVTLQNDMGLLDSEDQEDAL
ncbi:transcription factor IIIB 50 kDa subunit-like [Asterias rubens]|uniref:transcription factor IIIB 50 kDa subunit-like n=1 Tax=Asterias rubens TaxID=7604 RepID=UPI001454F9CE|nr:transcription factor IIIB 50 kDa subunit-like [Asterias rubens]